MHTLPLAHTLLLTLDLIGTFVFALSGAIAGVKRRLDLFGLRLAAIRRGWHLPIARAP